MGVRRPQNCNRNPCPMSGKKVAILSDFAKIDPKCPEKKIDLRTRRCPISGSKKKNRGKSSAQISSTEKGQNPWNSGPTPVARGGSEAKAPPLATLPSG